MPDTRVTLEYRCPVCGAAAVAGQHFCQTETPGSNSTRLTRRRPRKPWNSGGLVRLGALALVVGLLWTWVGPWSLLWLGLGLIGLLLWENRARDEQELLKLCGSQATANRLIEAESRRFPGLSRRQAAQRAAERLKRDRAR